MSDKCRRCGDCRGRTHHWMQDYVEGVEGEYACKHCPVRGIECPECGGDGCAHCQGEGVVPTDQPKPQPEHADLDAMQAYCEGLTKDWAGQYCRFGERDVAFFNNARTDLPAVIAELQEARDKLVERDKEIEWLRGEKKFLSVELTKINNIIQPLWGKVQARRIDAGRNPQTGEAEVAAEAAEGG